MKEAGEPYKVELIEDLPEDAELSFYEQGDFTDLCAGPHAAATGRVKVPKLLRTAGAYWRGDEKNKMLRRIYGIAFPTQKELDEHLQKLKEAEERDHNKLGRELHYFTTSPIVGQGLPLLMPKGARTIQLLQRFVEDEEERRGYVLTKTPYMAKSDLYKISGHWDHYKEGMFVLGDEEKDDEVLALRPMTCPFQYTVYNAEHHSYKDLPIRYGETSTLFRNEASGEMHGRPPCSATKRRARCTASSVCASLRFRRGISFVRRNSSRMNLWACSILSNTIWACSGSKRT